MAADMECDFYICPTCFATSEHALRCHGHRMIHCERMAAEDERRRPVMTVDGVLLTRAPRWFLEAVARMWLKRES